jgi:hypothetical protein
LTHDVFLITSEQMHVAIYGCGRNLRRLGSPQRYGGEKDPVANWGLDIESCGAEMAVAKFRRHYYAPGPDPDDADVAGWQVRWTRRPDGNLIVHPTDHLPCVLVTGVMPKYTIVGWIDADDAKREEWWGDKGTGRPAFWVPQAALVPFDRPTKQGGEAEKEADARSKL